jgi:hypothetical protein
MRQAYVAANITGATKFITCEISSNERFSTKARSPLRLMKESK